MRFMVIRIAFFWITILLLLFPAATGSAQDNMNITLTKIASEQDLLRTEITKLKDALKQIEWERTSNKQIIEHLKNAQDSSFWWINFILAWTLGLFTVLGVVGGLVAFGWTSLGFRSLKKFKEEYQSGLQDIENRKEDIARQNRAIRSLKPILRARALVDKKDYRRAEVFIDFALRIDPESDAALYLKYWCLIETGRTSASIQLLEKLQKMYPSDPDTVVNLLESYLLTGQLEKYRDRAECWQDLLRAYDEMENGLLIKYFDALRFYMSGDFQSMTQVITSTLDSLESAKEPVDFDWDFLEVRAVLASKPENDARDQLYAFLNELKNRTRPTA